MMGDVRGGRAAVPAADACAVSAGEGEDAAGAVSDGGLWVGEGSGCEVACG